MIADIVSSKKNLGANIDLSGREIVHHGFDA
jgi:hypothetical protein